MSRLPDPISEVLEDTAGEARVRRLWKGIEERRRPRATLSPKVWGSALAAAAALLLWLAWPSARTAPGPLRFVDGHDVTALEGPRDVRFDDGSSIELSSSALLVPIRNDVSTMSWRLVEGRARFSVTPGGPRRWQVDAGLALVEVVGTVFTVERERDLVRVEVERGVVVVRSADAVEERLTRGQSVTVRAPDAVEPDADEGGSAEDGDGDGPPQTSVGQASVGRTDHGRTSGAATGEPEARSGSPSASSAPPPSPARPEVNAESLMAEADSARREGRPEEAAAILERAVALSDDPAAGVAAFTLGRLELDVLHRGERAARAFSRALDLPLPPRLREDAAARLVEAHVSAGDEAAAGAAADAYLARHPDGRHADRVRPHASP